MAEPKKKYKGLLLSMLQEGKPIGNMAACSQLREKIRQLDCVTITEDQYRAIRNALVDEGKIARGKGHAGSIYLVPSDPALVAEANCDREDNKERKLYPAVSEIIKGPWAEEQGITENRIVWKTADNKIPGRWRNPDICMVTINNYDFIPGRTMELTTFEIKPDACFKVEGVFEAASHSVVAHRSYLVIQDKDKRRNKDLAFDYLKKLCIRFGVGLIVFEELGAEGTYYETIIEAKYQTPEPSELSDFLKNACDENLQRNIRDKTKA